MKEDERRIDVMIAFREVIYAWGNTYHGPPEVYNFAHPDPIFSRDLQIMVTYKPDYSDDKEPPTCNIRGQSGRLTYIDYRWELDGRTFVVVKTISRK